MGLLPPLPLGQSPLKRSIASTSGIGPDSGVGGLRFYTSTTAGVLSIGLIPANQEVRSPITLISCRRNIACSILRRPSPPVIISLMKVVTLLLMPSRPQWLSITFLIAGMRHIRVLLPLEILGHFAVLALPQILTHAIRGECVVRLLMTRITVVPLAMGPRHFCPLSIQLVLTHQLITVILPTELFPAVLLVLTALLVHTPRSQVVLARAKVRFTLPLLELRILKQLAPCP
jgi:hypothetical protein